MKLLLENFKNLDSYKQIINGQTAKQIKKKKIIIKKVINIMKQSLY
jgi:hypothetical protein